MVRKRVVRPAPREGTPDFRRMFHLLLWTGFVVALGLGHIHLRLATRDMAIQKSRLQAEREDLWNKRCALASDVARLSGGDNVLDYARNHGLEPVGQFLRWQVPRTIANKYEQTYSEIALARAGEAGQPGGEPLLARLLGTVLTPEAQAQPAGSGR